MPKKTFECAELAEVTLITQVKDNHKALCKQIAHGCDAQQALDVYEEPINKEHGRLEKRKYEVFSALPMLKNWREDWPYITEIVRVTRYREEVGKKSTTTTHYYVSNGSIEARVYAKYIREHWFIENKLHHVKDVAFREDGATKRVNPYIYSRCIDMALNIMRSIKVDNIKSELYKNSLDFFAFYEGIKNVI